MSVDVSELKRKLDHSLQNVPFLGDIEDRTGVPRRVIALIGSAIVLFVFFSGRVVTSFVGFVYPTYASYKALKTEKEGADTQWLTYWIVYSFFSMMETFTDFFLTWIPFYFLTKIVFLVWCMHPRTMGATMLYHSFIEPWLDRYEPTIEQGQQHASNLVADGFQIARALTSPRVDPVRKLSLADPANGEEIEARVT